MKRRGDRQESEMARTAEQRMELLEMAERAEELAGVLGEGTPGGYSLAMLVARYLRMEARDGGTQGGRSGA